jgi:hypothetical protein
MPDPKSRARVERLIRGTFRPDDLMLLFVYARDHCDGRESVAEIGHFVAHHHERDKGITTRATRQFFVTVRFHAPRFAPGGPHPLNAEKLPSVTPDYLRSAALRIDSKHIRRSARKEPRRHS